jgi:MYXO-CTERM domain-containing protein
VVNASSDQLPAAGSTLDAMRLSWGPYLWMRCYNNGAQFLDRVVGPRPDWAALEAAARAVPAGSGGVSVLPFVHPEPSRGVAEPRYTWTPDLPADPGVRFRAALEALAYLIALGVREHEQAGQRITRVSVSGGIARSELMGEILATVLGRPLERLVSSEGPALGAAAAALAGLEAHRRRERGTAEPYTVADTLARLVKFRAPVGPRPEWRAEYAAGLAAFERRLANA